jgi:hypothetical protein
MDKVLEQITKIISGIFDTQSTHSNDILRSRYEFLELLKVLKELGVIKGEQIERIYEKGEQYEQSNNQS